MKLFEFNYLKNFRCIASECKHNCCIGWNIKVDKRTLNKYNALKDKDARLQEKSFNNNLFRLDESLRCPLLDSDNLCHVIKNYGDKYLSKTCATHPRFKSFFTGATFTGLGLYCEEACRIILSLKTKMKPVLVKDDKKVNAFTKHEKKVLAFTNKCVKIVQDRKLDTSEKLSILSQMANVDLSKKSFNQWKEIFCSLEKLKTNEFSFSSIKDANSFNGLVDGFSREYEQLLSYLCYRHLTRAIDGLDLRVRLAFILLSFNLINHLFSLTDRTFSSLVECCRFFSSEIETSDDNIFTLLNEIESLISFI